MSKLCSVHVNYMDSLALYELCDGNRLQRTTCRRSDDILFNMCKFENIMKVDKSVFAHNNTIKNISYFTIHELKLMKCGWKKEQRNIIKNKMYYD